MAKWRWWQKAMLAVGVLGLIALVLFIFFKRHAAGGPFPLKSFLLWFIGLSVASGIIAGGIYFFITRKTDVDKNLQLVKEHVPTRRVKQIWIEEAIKDCNIEYIVQLSKPKNENGEHPIVPRNPRDIEITHERPFVDPMLGTDDEFLAFQVTMRSGTRPGMHMVIVRQDLGEKYVRDNWPGLVDDHKSWNRFKLENGKFPLTSPKSAVARLMQQRIALGQEGYSEEELQEFVDPLIRAQQGRRDDNYARPQEMQQATQSLPDNRVYAPQIPSASAEETSDSPQNDADRYEERRNR